MQSMALHHLWAVNSQGLRGTLSERHAMGGGISDEEADEGAAISIKLQQVLSVRGFGNISGRGAAGWVLWCCDRRMRLLPCCRKGNLEQETPCAQGKVDANHHTSTEAKFNHGGQDKQTEKDGQVDAL